MEHHAGTHAGRQVLIALSAFLIAAGWFFLVYLAVVRLVAPLLQSPYVKLLLPFSMFLIALGGLIRYWKRRDRLRRNQAL